MAPVVVVDTMIASAWLGRRSSPRKTRWQPLLEQAAWILPFSVVAELRFGAEVAGWGAQRRGVLDRPRTTRPTGGPPPLQLPPGCPLPPRT